MPSRRTIPNLSQLRRQAKDLHRTAKAGDPQALAEFTKLSKAVSLTSAQLVLARAYGFPSWTKLKEAVDSPDSWPARPTRIHPPRDELCAVVAGETFLGQSDQATVALTAIRVYNTGCALDIVWTVTNLLGRKSFREWTREAPEDEDPFEPVRSAGSWSRGFTAHWWVEFADGRTATNQPGELGGRPTPLPATAPSVACLSHRGGTDGPNTYHGTAEVYVCPLPPPGELRLTLEWPAFDIPATTTVLDGDQINAATERVKQLA